ncbi:HTH-type transcriptional regulator MhqR [BD1-7 clade bacterium]|uniref:HTH-type transcriptional regulator MhqR n=1 Tax=BD1-7 clade bacterium TaxID=2029982 RepID=A0A5S9Q168_9GAMM|nr:HTH-type transcriptional regulator MhqR [BD1-7 clade bacterium]CAA0112517.1 HTH-type transcriptional regulator MhqR [BD1-7 clade bacterium]
MDLTDSITYQITKTGNMLRQLTAKRIKSMGIDVTPEEAVILNQLWDRDNQTITELGQWSVKDASTLTRQVDSLEKKGYVVREHGTDDRRKVFVHLSEDGLDLRAKFDATNVPQMDNELADIATDDLAVCLKVILQIRQNALDEINRK